MRNAVHIFRRTGELLKVRLLCRGSAFMTYLWAFGDNGAARILQFNRSVCPKIRHFQSVSTADGTGHGANEGILNGMGGF